MSAEHDPYPGNLRFHQVDPAETGTMPNVRRMQRRIDDLEEQLELLAMDRLTAEVFSRVGEWLRNPARKPAATAFTSGMERQIALLLEGELLAYDGGRPLAVLYVFRRLDALKFTAAPVLALGPGEGTFDEWQHVASIDAEVWLPRYLHATPEQQREMLDAFTINHEH